LKIADVTVKDLLTERFGEQNGARLLEEIQDRIDKKLPAQELKEKFKNAAKQIRQENARSIAIETKVVAIGVTIF
jgi:hypothetical protein